jgi:hypothetical protein
VDGPPTCEFDKATGKEGEDIELCSAWCFLRIRDRSPCEPHSGVPLISSASVPWSLNAASRDVQIAGNDRRDGEQGLDLAQVLDVSDRLNPRKVGPSYSRATLPQETPSCMWWVGQLGPHPARACFPTRQDSKNNWRHGRSCA